MHSAVLPLSSAHVRDRIGIAEILRVLRRRRLFILLVIGLSVALAMLWLKSTTPLFTATAVLKVDTVTNELDPNPVDPAAIQQQEELKISTVLELLKSRDLALKVISKLRLDENPNFYEPEAAEDQQGLLSSALGWLVEREERDLGDEFDADDLAEIAEDQRQVAVVEYLLDRVSVERVDRSRLIEISATVDDPVLAVRIANSFATIYIAHQQATQRKNNKAAIKDLRDRLAELQVRLRNAESAVASYERDRDLPAGGNQVTAAADMSRLGSQLADIRAERAAAETRYRGLSSAAPIGTSPLLTSLRAREAELRTKIAQLSAHYGEGHPDVIAATAELADVSGRVAHEAGQVSKDLQNAIAVQAARENQLAGALGSVRARAFRQGSDAVGLMALERDAETTRTLYLSLLSQLKQREANSRSDKADASIASQAMFPNQPSYPLPGQVIGVSLAGSSLVAFLLAFVMQMADQRVRTAHEIETLFGYKTLAMLPIVVRPEGGSPHREMLDRPDSLFAETVRGLYLELKAIHAPQVLVVTSALPGEGKTTIALSLAAAAASAGARAVTVELDLRRPGVFNAIGRPSGAASIIDYFDERATLDEIIVTDDRLPGLASICAHQPPRGRAMLLSSPRLAAMLAALRERFDFIVLNAPPILPVRDAKTLAEIADATLFVSPWGAKTDVLHPAFQMLGDKVAGVVINKVDFRKHARQAHGDAIQHYGLYAGYYMPDEPQRPTAGTPGAAVPRQASTLAGDI